MALPNDALSDLETRLREVNALHQGRLDALRDIIPKLTDRLIKLEDGAMARLNVKIENEGGDVFFRPPISLADNGNGNGNGNGPAINLHISNKSGQVYVEPSSSGSSTWGLDTIGGWAKLLLAAGTVYWWRKELKIVVRGVVAGANLAIERLEVRHEALREEREWDQRQKEYEQVAGSDAQQSVAEQMKEGEGDDEEEKESEGENGAHNEAVPEFIRKALHEKFPTSNYTSSNPSAGPYCRACGTDHGCGTTGHGCAHKEEEKATESVLSPFIEDTMTAPVWPSFASMPSGEARERDGAMRSRFLYAMPGTLPRTVLSRAEEVIIPPPPTRNSYAPV